MNENYGAEYEHNNIILEALDNEMSRWGYELDQQGLETIARLLDNCHDCDCEFGDEDKAESTINFLSALAAGAKAALEVTEDMVNNN